jgi:hypothetical protein
MPMEKTDIKERAKTVLMSRIFKSIEKRMGLSADFFVN